MNNSDNTNSYDCIKNVIMKDKVCLFEFHQVGVAEVERLLCSLLDSKLAGLDNMDSKLLRSTAGIIAPSVCHILIDVWIWAYVQRSGKRLKLFPYLRIPKPLLMR